MVSDGQGWSAMVSDMCGGWCQTVSDAYVRRAEPWMVRQVLWMVRQALWMVRQAPWMVRQAVDGQTGAVDGQTHRDAKLIRRAAIAI